MFQLNRYVLFFLKITLIGYVIAFPDKYEFQDTDTNMKFNLLDILNDYTENEKERRSESVEDPLENWKGRWFPSRPDDPTPPPKVFSTKVITKVHHDDRIPMGVKSVDCDDGQTNLTVDWDYSSSSYTCFGQKIIPELETIAEEYCESIPKQYVAMHKCMSEKIEYDTDIPLYGTHRPIWPVYGEYKYLPKQRWIHSLEHGAVVMLYHPCANSLEIDSLKKLVKGCMHRYIITPYNLLDEERPLALLTWGCRLTMSYVNQVLVTKFIQEHALQAPEKHVYTDGEFNDQLIEKAKIVSNEQDSMLCANTM